MSITDGIAIQRGSSCRLRCPSCFEEQPARQGVYEPKKEMIQLLMYEKTIKMMAFCDSEAGEFRVDFVKVEKTNEAIDDLRFMIDDWQRRASAIRQVIG